MALDAEANEDHDQNYLRSGDLVTDRLEWRKGFDKQLRRLVHDTDLVMASDAPMATVHRQRCDRLDKIHGWFEMFGQKEVRKEKEAPNFIRFNADSATMAGSLRPAPQRHSVVFISSCTSVGTTPDTYSQGLCASAPVGDYSEVPEKLVTSTNCLFPEFPEAGGRTEVRKSSRHFMPRPATLPEIKVQPPVLRTAGRAGRNSPEKRTSGHRRCADEDVHGATKLGGRHGAAESRRRLSDKLRAKGWGHPETPVASS